MKYFGFIKELDDYTFSEGIKDLIKEDAKPCKDKDLILAYLKRGILCVPLMGVVEDANDPNYGTDEYDDEKNDFLGYLAIYTDGEWYWPEYVITYIEKYPHFKLDEDFVKHVKNNKDKKIELSEQKIKELDNYFIKKNWNPSKPF